MKLYKILKTFKVMIENTSYKTIQSAMKKPKVEFYMLHECCQVFNND